MFNKSRDCEDSRQEQSLLVAQTPSRERAHQEARFDALQDVDELKHVSCSRAELPQEAYVVSLNTKSSLGKEFRESHAKLIHKFFHGRPAEKHHFGIAVQKNQNAVNTPVFEHERQDKCVLVPIICRKQCVGLKKSRCLLQLTIQRRRDRFWTTIPELRDPCCEDCHSAENYSEFELQEKGRTEEQKAKNCDRFLRGRQIAFRIS